MTEASMHKQQVHLWIWTFNIDDSMPGSGVHLIMRFQFRKVIGVGIENVRVLGVISEDSPSMEN